jgi:hypothetical protein
MDVYIDLFFNHFKGQNLSRRHSTSNLPQILRQSGLRKLRYRVAVTFSVAIGNLQFKDQRLHSATGIEVSDELLHSYGQLQIITMKPAIFSCT